MKYKSVEDLLRDADIAMYRAKASRNSHVTFTADMHAQVVARVSLEDDMRRALERDEFTVCYQPIVSLSTGVLAGFEALARWNHPQRGSVPADAFIPLAERLGLIGELGLRMLQAAAAQLAEWTRQFPDNPITMSANLSPRQLNAERLPGQLKQILESTGADPSRMILEITEGYLADDCGSADQLLRQMREMGFRVAIDDFGIGHSSLARLPVLPIDAVKIDRSFLRHASTQRKFVAIINAVVNLAYHIDATVVAEGIETLEQIALLQTLNCELGQGYYFSAPLPASQVERFFTERWLANRSISQAA
jgi:EAL domain-containing protein (putative c-di-GMP-specific phosphodiesterase class I)